MGAGKPYGVGLFEPDSRGEQGLRRASIASRTAVFRYRQSGPNHASTCAYHCRQHCRCSCHSVFGNIAPTSVTGRSDCGNEPSRQRHCVHRLRCFYHHGCDSDHDDEWLPNSAGHSADLHGSSDSHLRSGNRQHQQHALLHSRRWCINAQRRSRRR